MRTAKTMLIVLSCLLLAAHFSRAGWEVLAIASVALPLLLLPGRPAAARVVQVGLLLGGLEWLRTLVRIAARRIDGGEDWIRLAVILGAVTVVTFVAARAVEIPPGPSPHESGAS